MKKSFELIHKARICASRLVRHEAVEQTWDVLAMERFIKDQLARDLCEYIIETRAKITEEDDHNKRGTIYQAEVYAFSEEQLIALKKTIREETLNEVRELFEQTFSQGLK